MTTKKRKKSDERVLSEIPSTRNSMPELPRVLDKLEARRTPEIMRMILEKYGTAFVEIKRRGGKVLPHQRKNLQDAAGDTGMYWKIRDDGGIQPFDGFCARNALAFVVWIEKDGRLTIEKVS
jgi:hypothetical protein